MSLNHLKSEGAQHLARLIVTLPSLQQLHVSAIGMRADGLQALSMQVRDSSMACRFALYCLGGSGKTFGLNRRNHLYGFQHFCKQLCTHSLCFHDSQLPTTHVHTPQASYVPKLRVLNMSANPTAFETPEAMDLLVTLLMRAPHGLNLNVGHCMLDSARVEGLCRGGMIGKRGLRGLGLSGNMVTKQVCLLYVCGHGVCVDMDVY